MKIWFKKNLSRKSKLSSGKIIMAKYSKIERKKTITFMKYVNQPVMNAAQEMRLKMTTTKKYINVETAGLIIKKDMNMRK